MDVDFCFRYDEPFVCTAIHNGNGMSRLAKSNLGITEEIRFREEDPKTEFFADICYNKIINYRSRFECDLNRPREKAVYMNPEDAWGLKVRKEVPGKEQINTAYNFYDTYYRRVKSFYDEMQQTFGSFFVYDIHSYNHHRLGSDAPFDDPIQNPEIILGTTNMDAIWQPLIDKIEKKMNEYDFNGRSIDVRQNVKFTGGHFSRWTHSNYGKSACSVAIEFKKIFMDEWTGEFFPDIMQKLREILASTKPLILDHVLEMNKQ